MHRATICVVLLLFSFCTNATETFQLYLNELLTEAKAQGISSATIERAMPTIIYRESVVKADRNQPEKRITLDSYLQTRVPEWKVLQAAEKYHEHKDLLEDIAKKYSVQARFIVALWGNESNFGRIQGNHPVLSSLASLAFEGRREALFKRQFLAAMRIIDEQHIDIDNFKGSWAGAMGQSQFMPTNFLAYAVDYNKDGKKDIWNTPADVFASIANFLLQHGWNSEHTWGRQVKLSMPVGAEQYGLSNSQSKLLSSWSGLGITRFDGADLPKVDIKAWLIAPDGPTGRTYLVYDNFQTLMRWNRSSYFGISVSFLSERLKKAVSNG